MSLFRTVPLVGGGERVLNKRDAPRRADPHPHKPIVSVTFFDGVQLHIDLPWSELVDWFDGPDKAPAGEAPVVPEGDRPRGRRSQAEG